jgi:hypothetical protein
MDAGLSRFKTKHDDNQTLNRRTDRDFSAGKESVLA